MLVDLHMANGQEYTKLLSAVGALSRLYSDSKKPYIHYRFVENIFCRCFKAKNLSRTDTAFDAQLNSIGVGLKTFTLNGNLKTEKIAEFNAVSSTLINLDIKSLAIKVADFRNERIKLAKRTYKIESGVYHIVGRDDNKILIFETDYDEIKIENIKDIAKTKGGIKFNDGINEYSFNKSKSTLFRKFILPREFYEQEVQIINDAYALLNELLPSLYISPKKAGVNYVVLPLYSNKQGNKTIPQKSGLNQWNAGGRKRDAGEIYVPVPAFIHRQCAGFFPSRDVEFCLQIPSGEKLSAKLCQDGAKALMTNPNNAMSGWLLRCVLGLNEGELATYDKLRILGFDSVLISKIDNANYLIDIAPIGSWEKFIATLTARTA